METLMNRLAQEISPYLLQHQHNPVDWYPWGQEALARAKAENKPIFLSIGYATCHWCHVMEGDSFEKEDVAAILNQHFVAIKVDREERPDVDSLYMKAVQAMNQRGGWPLSVMLTPEGRPFWGGTFFPREQFKDILQQIAQLWRQRRSDIDDSAAEITAHIEHISSQSAAPQAIDEQVLATFTQHELRSYDSEWGGFGGAPKFPPAMALMALLRQYKSQGNPQILAAIRGTLDGMARGGMRDHVGGGFHRYSVDETWLVPHFEKMLYDNALLTLAYSEAYQITHDASYADVVHSTLTYVLRDMQSAEGGFYSAEDADSEKTEGKFYVWTTDELLKRLSPDEWQTFQQYFSVEKEGNFTIDRRVEELEEAAGLKAVRFANILHHQKKAQIPLATEDRYAVLLQKLARLRDERVRPLLDDKILCFWNGLMIAACARAHRVFGHASYREAATRAADFVLKSLRKEGRLLRSYRAGQARFSAYLEDYAGLIYGLIELYQASFESRWLQEAFTLQAEQDRLFWDESEGAYFETDGQDPTLILRSKEMGDNAVPSGNSLSAINLLQLSALAGDLNLETKAKKIISRSSELLKKFPQALPMLLLAVDRMAHPSQELIVSADPSQPLVWPDLCPLFTPHLVVLRYDQDLEKYCPTLKGKVAKLGQTVYYLCEKGSCQQPTTDHEEFLHMLSYNHKKADRLT